jgi:biotin operon repressor
MSGAAMKWAKQQRIADGPLGRTVDLLAQMVDDNSMMFHSQKTIAGRLHCSHRTLWARLQELEQLEVISRGARSRGRGLGRTSDWLSLNTKRNFVITRQQVKDMRKSHKLARRSPQSTETYNSQILLMQLAKIAKHDQPSDQPKKFGDQEELNSIGEEELSDQLSPVPRLDEKPDEPSITIEAFNDRVAA